MHSFWFLTSGKVRDYSFWTFKPLVACCSIGVFLFLYLPQLYFQVEDFMIPLFFYLVHVIKWIEKWHHVQRMSSLAISFWCLQQRMSICFICFVGIWLHEVFITRGYYRIGYHYNAVLSEARHSDESHNFLPMNILPFVVLIRWSLLPFFNIIFVAVLVFQYKFVFLLCLKNKKQIISLGIITVSFIVVVWNLWYWM